MTETKITERIISGTGVLRLPPAENAVRYYSVLVDVIRLPIDINRSFRYNPYRQRFATAVFLRGGYVIDEQPIDYVKRRFDFVINEPGQVLIALKCSHGQLLSVLAGSGTPAASAIETFANLNMVWDEIRFVCHSSTALKVQLYEDEYDQCGDDYREKSPPPPPEQAPPDENNTPIADISPPYEDDDVTSKDPIDEYFEPEPPEFPQGERCAGYLIEYSFQPNGGGPRVEGQQPHFGEIEFVGIDPGNGTLGLIISHGLILTPGSPCLTNPVGYNAGSSSSGIVPGSFEYTITPL